MAQATTITSFADSRFSWLHESGSWNVHDPTGDSEGSQGRHELSPDGAELTIQPPAFKDFWRRTYYSPTLIKGDAPGLLCAVPASEECTIQLDFSLTPRNQFDQAGVLVFLDASRWLKAGIEFCDGHPRLSVVVCNVFSDWSTQPWPGCGARLRVHKLLQGSTVVVEAAQPGSDSFEFVRIAHLSSRASHGGPEVEGEAEARGAAEEAPWRMGPFAACPMAQRGCVARFSRLSLGPRVAPMHSSDASAMTA